MLLLNTDFARPQLLGVIEREQPQAVIYDAEFENLLEGAEGEDPELTRIVSWVDDDYSGDRQVAEEVIARNSDAPLDPPDEPSRFVILTSGTTGTPKGAQRGSPGLARAAGDPALEDPDAAPSGRTVIAAPLFHSWGFAQLRVRPRPRLHLRAAAAVRPGGDAEDGRRQRRRRARRRPGDAAADHRARPGVARPATTLPSLRVTAASGSALPGDLAIRWMDSFGDNLYNLYGSTEVGWATIATPEDMRAAPGTAGRAAARHRGQDPRRGRRGAVADGETGRIFVGNEMSFEGYTGGGGKDVVDGLLSSGDVGHFDEGGRLFIDGRDDEMIVSGGENVFPREVEDLLADHEAIDEAAVIGVDDEKFGQRLKAFVVTSAGAELDEAEVKDYVKENLARYKVPREVEFLDELPRNPTGKVLKRELE